MCLQGQHGIVTLYLYTYTVQLNTQMDTSCNVGGFHFS